ncbi:hypothetical protein [Novosphingobium sp.]|nr:hypothetical protein [Novosphingobium sp.]
MAKALAFVTARPLPQLEELLRPVLVIGCALALILAGSPFPSVL